MSYNNAYVRRLFENEPTEKELEAIKKEKPAKIPKKRYFGGATNPKDVDTKAAIASHAAGIKAAGKAAVKKNQDERDKAESKNESVAALAGTVLKNPAVRKLARRAVASRGKAQAGDEGVATGDDAARKRKELQQQQASDNTLNAGTEYLNSYVKKLLEAHQAYVDKKSKEDLKAGKADAGFAGPIARGAADSSDPVVQSGQAQAQKTLDKRIGKPTKTSKENLTQIALLKRRKRNKGKGLPGGPLPKGASAALKQRELETPDDNPRTRRSRR